MVTGSIIKNALDHFMQDTTQTKFDEMRDTVLLYIL